MNLSQGRYQRLRSVALTTLAVLLALAAAIGLGKAFQYTHWSGFVPVQTPTRGGKAAPTIGQLGGVAMHIPPFVADYPEFDGDPTWVHWPLHQPRRATSTSIRRFGFLLQHPSMQMVYDPSQRSKAGTALELEADHPWLLAQAVSGEQFPGPGALRRFVRERVPDESSWPDAPPNGRKALVELKPFAVPPPAGATAGHSHPPDDRHLAYDAQGRLLAYLACSNDPVLPRHCLQVWSLEDQGWPVLMSVHYRRTLQADWALIQKGVTEALLAMRVSP
ncbi:hypothetical protein [Hydrogenophaga sp.]|uniref:hypothetical protein n=1 Tax=Hydrogenophaga sp. TaxID=1904254 RepID=UPI003D14393B